MCRLIGTRTVRTGTLAAVTLALGAVSAGAQTPSVDASRKATTGRAAAAAAARPVAARVIGTHQIDRYTAIRGLQDSLKQNPGSLADWIILGELAHEVGVDSPVDHAAGYFKLSRQAYEKALALAPERPGLKAAVQFARDYEEGIDRFAQTRDRATQAYLEARRRDLAATEYVPAIRVAPYVPPASPNAMGVDLPALTRAANSPTPAQAAAGAVAAADPAPAISPPPGNSASTDAANFGVRQIYSSTPLYAPYYTPQGKPLTYQQYRSAYYPPGMDTDAGPLPVTLQRFSQQYMLDASRRPVDPTYTTPKTGNAPDRIPIP